MKRFTLIPDWHLTHRLWSVRIALFWAGLCGLYGAFSVFADLLNPILFAGVSMLMSMAIAIARITKQPGLHDGE